MKLKLILGVCAIALFLGVCLAIPTQTLAASNVYYVGYVDAHGHVTYWSGSYADQQKVIHAERAKRIAAAQLWSKTHTQHKSNVITNIYRVSGCSSGRNDYYDLRNGTNPPVCFADAGNTGRINVYCVFEVWTGNNTGYFTNVNYYGQGITVSTPNKYTPYYAAGGANPECPASTFNDITSVNIY